MQTKTWLLCVHLLIQDSHHDVTTPGGSSLRSYYLLVRPHKLNKINPPSPSSIQTGWFSRPTSHGYLVMLVETKTTFCWIYYKGIGILSIFDDFKTQPAHHIWLIWCLIANCILTHVMSMPRSHRRSGSSSSSGCLPTDRSSAAVFFFQVLRLKGTTVNVGCVVG